MASMPSEHTITIRAELDNAVVVKPGGAIVVGLKRRINMAEAARIKEHIGRDLPGVNVVIIDGIDHMAVYAPPDYEFMASQIGKVPWHPDVTGEPL